MKKLIFTCLIMLMGSFIVCNAQIDSLIVETYYVSDSYDSTDTMGNIALEPGTKTYRIYLDLAPGCRLKKLYGDTNHILKISSTGNFYNNLDREYDCFGYMMRQYEFDDNPTMALDSWLTLGLAAKASGTNPARYSGILKPGDTDGSFSEIILNSGGTAGIQDGLLRNTDPLSGIPLLNVDGYVPYTDTLGQWVDYGFLETPVK